MHGDTTAEPESARRTDAPPPVSWVPFGHGPDGLGAVFQALSQVREPAEATALICRGARELTGADGATFVVQEGNGVRYLDEDAVSPLWKGQWFPLESCISGWAIRERQTAIIEDVYVDARIPIEAYRPTFVRSLMMTPVRAPAPVAAIGVYWSTPHRATEREAQTVRTLAYAADLAFSVARHHEQMRRARDEAEEASRLKDEFLATLSHELRTPLNAILGWSSLMLGDLDEATRLRGARVIERNARAQAELIDELLDMSRIVTGKLRLTMAALDLRTVLEAAIETVLPAAVGRGVQIELVSGGSVAVNGSATRLQQIAWNLLSNAVKFTPRGGLVRVRLAASDGQAVLEVSDSGVGIDPLFLPHVFERFRQADGSTTRQHGGLGLGLAIVKHLTEAHGGFVEAESTGQGRGATFRVVLPLGRQRVPAVPAAPTRSLDGVRVLMVDDDEDCRELFGKVLERSGARVSEAASMVECLEALRGWQPDLLVSDIGMPGADGYTLIRAVRSHPDERIRKVPALALTGYVGSSDRARALAAGFDEHASKPLMPGALLTLVAALASRGQETG